jgi:hypothetical protein
MRNDDTNDIILRLNSTDLFHRLILKFITRIYAIKLSYRYVVYLGQTFSFIATVT